MKLPFTSLFFCSAILVAPVALRAADKPAATATTTTATLPAISTAQLSEGLKSGLGTIITQSVTPANVTVAPPSALSKIEALLSKSGNTESTAAFKTALAEAVAKVAPQASSLLTSALSTTTISDPKAVLAGGNDAGTQYLKKAIGPTVREQLLPLVKQATAASGVAAKAQTMLGSVNALAAMAGKKSVSDIDSYVTDQVLEQSFALMSKQEAAVRANPALLTNNAAAQKVFALFKK